MSSTEPYEVQYNRTAKTFINYRTGDPHWVLITPDMAKEILSTLNTANRGFKKHRVDRYSEDMKAGLWIPNGASIAFRFRDDTSDAQVLCDGQNRLEACVRSGSAFIAIVVCRLPPLSFEVTDKGANRTAGDDLTVAKEKNANVLASAARQFYMTAPKEFGGLGGVTNTRVMSHRIVANIVADHPDLRWACSLVTGSLKKPSLGLFPSTALAACIYMTSRRDKVAAVEFATKSLSGVMLEKDTPEFLLNRRLTEIAGSRAKLNNFDMIAHYLVAWRMKRRGEKKKYLRWTPEQNDFPGVEA
jgi:hypothetical protein